MQNNNYSEEAEQNVVGACVTYPEAYENVSGILKPRDFYDFKLRMLYESLSELYDSGSVVDEVTVNAKYQTKQDTQNEADLLWHVCRNCCGRAAVAQYADIMRNHTVARDVIDAGKRIMDIGCDTTMNAASKASAVATLVDGIMNNQADSGFTPYRQVLKGAIEQLQKRFESGSEISGLDTGFKFLNQITGGFQDSDLIVLAGRPSMGKSILMMALAEYVSLTQPVFVFSLEMSGIMLANRSISSNSGIDFDTVKSGKLQERDWPMLTSAVTQLNTRKLFVDDRGGITIEQLRSRARVAARKYGCGMIMVDYLTLVQADGENQNLRVARISAGLKNMAKELGCPVVALAQLNREVDKRPDKRPLMSDLRDSGGIEQDADLIMFNYLEEKYNKETHMKGILEVVVRKHRNGDTGSLWFDFDGKRQRITTRNAALPNAPEKPNPGKGYRYKDKAAGEAA